MIIVIRHLILYAALRFVSVSLVIITIMIIIVVRYLRIIMLRKYLTFNLQKCNLNRILMIHAMKSQQIMIIVTHR